MHPHSAGRLCTRLMRHALSASCAVLESGERAEGLVGAHICCLLGMPVPDWQYEHTVEELKRKGELNTKGTTQMCNESLIDLFAFRSSVT